MKYKLIKLYCRLFRRNYNKIIIKHFRKNGIKIGKNCRIYSDIKTTESYLIELGDNVTISTNVVFLTHDNSISKIDYNYTDMFGKIKIGNNCFIGANSIILPGVELCENTIVGSGAVVTKSITEAGMVVAGNPAKKICSIEEFLKKNKKYASNIRGMNKEKKKEYLGTINLIKR